MHYAIPLKALWTLKKEEDTFVTSLDKKLNQREKGKKKLLNAKMKYIG